MLQCVAVCCSVLQCVAVCCSVLQRPVVGAKFEDEMFEGACVLQNDLTHAVFVRFQLLSVLQCVATWCSALQCVAVCCSVLQRVVVCYSVLQ